MAIDDTVGSDLPTMNTEQQAAFAAEEAAAAQAREAAKGGGFERLHQEPDHDGSGDPSAEPAPAPAAPAAPAAQPAAAQPAAPSSDDEVEGAVAATDGSKYVPVSAHVQQRKNFQGQVTDLKTALDKANATNEALLKALQSGGRPAPAAPAAEPPPAPPTNPHNPETHPLEHERWERQQLQKRLDAVEESGRKSSEQIQHERAYAGARSAYVASHQSFVKQNPQYSDAYNFTMDTLVKANMAIGMSHPEAVQAAEVTEWNIVQRAVQANKMPSQMLWDLAKASGWKEPAPAVPAPSATGQPGAEPTTPAAPSPEKQIQIAKQGAAAAISLSDAAGGAAPQQLTLATAAKMSKEEFASLSDDQFRKLVMPKRSAAAA